MRAHTRWLARLIPTALLSVTMPAVAAPIRISGEQWADLDRHEIVVTVGPKTPGLRFYQVMGEVNAAPATVWKVITDFERHDQIYSMVAASTIQKRIGANVFINHKEIKLPWPLSNRTTLGHTTIHPERFCYEWYSIGGDIGEQRGGYYLMPRKGKTLLVYQINFNPMVSWLPQNLISLAQRIALPSVIKDVRKAAPRY